MKLRSYRKLKDIGETFIDQACGDMRLTLAALVHIGSEPGGLAKQSNKLEIQHSGLWSRLGEKRRGDNMEPNETLKLAGDMKALRAEHGTTYARKQFKKIVAGELEKAKTGEIINLSSLFCAKEALE